MKVVVVGAGLAGSVAARILTDLGHHVEVFESRGHLGGNCHDSWKNGILVHQYGPHCFHTDKEAVWRFLGRFTRFRETSFGVMANTRVGLIPVPFNDVSSEIAGDLSDNEIRDLIFVDYSAKHWGIPWSKLPACIKNRVPKRRPGRDCRYHLDRWQGIPEEGFTRMFEAMLEGIPVHMGCGESDWRKVRADHVVFTGSIDDYFGHNLGSLEYRSLDFEYTLEPKREHFQINECNRTHSWTRAVDHSHWLDQKVEQTVIGKEFPREWDGTNLRYYPKPFGPNPALYKRYRDLADTERNVTFVGRLATYKYIDMDDVVAQVMTKLSRLTSFEIPSSWTTL